MEETAISGLENGKTYLKSKLVRQYYPYPEKKLRNYMCEIMRLCRADKKVSEHSISHKEFLILAYKMKNRGTEIEDIVDFELYKEKKEVA